MPINLDLVFYDYDRDASVYQLFQRRKSINQFMYISVSGYQHHMSVADNIGRMCCAPLLFRDCRAPWKKVKYYIICKTSEKDLEELRDGKKRLHAKTKSIQYPLAGNIPYTGIGYVKINVGLIQPDSNIFKKEFTAPTFRDGDDISGKYSSPKLVRDLLYGGHDHIDIIKNRYLGGLFDTTEFRSSITDKKKEWIVETGVMLAQKFARENNIIGY